MTSCQPIMRLLELSVMLQLWVFAPFIDLYRKCVDPRCVSGFHLSLADIKICSHPPYMQAYRRTDRHTGSNNTHLTRIQTGTSAICWDLWPGYKSQSHSLNIFNCYSKAAIPSAIASVLLASLFPTPHNYSLVITNHNSNFACTTLLNKLDITF